MCRDNYKAGAIPSIDSRGPQTGTAEGILRFIAIARESQRSIGDTGLLNIEPGPSCCGECRKEVGVLRGARIDEDLSRGCVSRRAPEHDHRFWLTIAREIAKNRFENVVVNMVQLCAAISDPDGNGMIRIAGKGVGKIAPIDLL